MEAYRPIWTGPHGQRSKQRVKQTFMQNNIGPRRDKHSVKLVNMSAIIYELILFLAAFTTCTESRGNSQTFAVRCIVLAFIYQPDRFPLSLFGTMLLVLCFHECAVRGHAKRPLRASPHRLSVWRIDRIGREKLDLFPLFGNAIVRCAAPTLHLWIV